MVKKSRVMLFGVVLAAAAMPIYKWVDEAGNVHYADQPPPEHDTEEVALLPAPGAAEVQKAQQRLDGLLAAQRANQEQRAAAQEQERLERELEEAQRVARVERCVIAQQNLHSLQLPRPVYHIDAKGERVFLDDAQRAAEMERVRSEVDTYCD